MMTKTCKILIILLTITLVLGVGLFAVSCSGGDSTPSKVVPTLTKVKVIPALYGHNGDEESDVCLSKTGGNVEKFHLEITISNPDSSEVISLNYNDTTYTSDTFSSESNYAKIVIRDLVAPVTEGDFEVKIDEIFYQSKEGKSKIFNLKNNVKRVRIQPIFTLTLDFSEANLIEGDQVVTTVENDYLSPLKLPSPSDMNDSETDVEDKRVYGWQGYIFDGWYSEQGGGGTRYDNYSKYTMYKDVTLYAHYARAITYEAVDDEIVVTGITKEGLNTTFPIVIPREIDSLPVRKIGDHAFSGALAGKMIILPDTIVEIGNYSFYNCKGINIDLGSVEKIGTMAFAESGEIKLGKGKDYFAIGEANLPNTLKEIGTSAFKGCYWKTRAFNPYRDSSFRPENPTLMLPASLEKIGDRAFLESGFSAVYFHQDIALTTLNFGVSVFEGSKSLTSIYTSYYFTESGPVISTAGSSGVIDFPYKTFYNCTALKCSLASIGVKLNEGLISIGELAFASSGSGMVGLNYISFPDSLESIGDSAFANTGLTSVNFNETSNLRTLENHCFENSKFESITLYSINSYGPAPFYGNTALVSINIITNTMPTYVEPGFNGEGLTRKAKYYVRKELIPSYRAENSSWYKGGASESVCAYDYITTDTQGTKLCFEPVDENGDYDVTSLNIKITSVFDLTSEIRIPKTILFNDITYSVVSVGKFFVHDEIYKIYLPATLKTIEEKAFYACADLYECVWVEGYQELGKGKNGDIALEYIGDNAFYGTALTYFYSNTALKVIGKQAFHNCKNLATVVLDKGTSLAIKGSAFSQSGLKSLAIGQGVSRVYDSAFQNNDNLTLVLINLVLVPCSNDNRYPGLATAPLSFCDNINYIYLFSQEAIINFTSSRTDDGSINGWSSAKDPSGNTLYRLYNGSWEDALSKYNL